MTILQLFALLTISGTAAAAVTTAGRLLAHQWALVARELDPTVLAAYPSFDLAE